MKGRQLYVAMCNGEMPDQMILGRCPVCDDMSTTVECRWCGVDIGIEEQKISDAEVREYLAFYGEE